MTPPFFPKNVVRMSKGMTLIELMLAIGIAAVLSVLATQFLTGIITSDERTEIVTKDISRLQKGMLYIERDLYQLVKREIRTGQGEVLKHIVFDDEYLLEFTRTGWRNPRKQLRSRMQRVAYALVPMSEDTCQTLLTPEQIALDTVPDGFCFVRYYWPVLDRLDNDTGRKAQPMLSEVNTLEVSFFVNGNGMRTWVNQLPTNPKTKILAFKFTFDIARIGTIERIFTIASIDDWEEG